MNSNIVRPGYVRLPEDRGYEREEWENLKLCTSELDLMEWPGEGGLPLVMLLDLRKTAYEKKKDDYILIEAFMIAHEAKLFPPLWIIKGLYERFNKWHTENMKGEERSLDEFFKTGSKPVWRERTYESVYVILQQRYLQLKYYWKLNDPEIFKVLAWQVNETGIKGEDDTKHVKLTFSERTIKELHKKHKWSDAYKWYKSFLDERKPFLESEDAESILHYYPEKAQAFIMKYKKREPTEDYTTD